MDHIGQSDATIDVTFLLSGGGTQTETVTVSVVEFFYHDTYFADRVGTKITELETTYSEGWTIDTRILEDLADATDYTYTSDNEDVATIDASGKITVKGVGTTFITARKPASADGRWAAALASLTLTVNGSSFDSADGSSDVKITFNGTFDNFDSFEIDGTPVTVNADKTLSGYPGYTGNIGSYMIGSTIVTFNSDFIQHLQSRGITNFSFTYNDRSDAVAAPTVYTVDLTVRALQTFTVSFDANGGSGTMADVNLGEQPGTMGVNYRLPDSTFKAPEGKQFARWGASIDNSPEYIDSYHEAGDMYEVMGDITFYAIYEDAPIPPTGNADIIFLLPIAFIASFTLFISLKKGIKNSK